MASVPANTTLPGLDIIIVNWNAGRHLRECLASVAAARRSSCELRSVVVVDNASSDDSLDGLDRLELPLHVLRNGENRGFAAACNQGARVGDSELVLFLNPDTRLLPDTLDATAAFLDDPRNAGVGICGVQMLDANGERTHSCSRFPTLTMFAAHMVGVSRLFPGMFPSQRLFPEETSRSGVVDQVIGAYFLMRRSLFEALDGFDERFFVYLEDVDLAYRARQHGYPNYFFADVFAYHEGSVSSDQVRGRRLFYLLRSRTRYARKHWPLWQAALLSLLTVLVELPARAIIAALRGRRTELTEVAEAASLYMRYLYNSLTGGPGQSRVVRPRDRGQ